MEQESGTQWIVIIIIIIYFIIVISLVMDMVMLQLLLLFEMREMKQLEFKILITMIIENFEILNWWK